MDHYDVIIIGSGAGGGTLARHLAPSGKRILILERGDWLPREPQNWGAEDSVRRRPLRLRGHLVRRATASRSSRRSTTSSVARRSSTVRRCTGSARRTSASSSTTTASRRRGRSRTTRWSRTTLKAEQRYHVHGARGEDPTEPAASGPYPYPAVSHEPRIQELSDDLAARGYHPFHAPCGILLDEVNPRTARASGARTATGSRASCMQNPTPRSSASGRRSSMKTSRCCDGRRPAARDRWLRPERHQGGGRARRRGGGVWRRHRRRRLRRGEYGPAAARVGQRPPSERARERLRSGRPQLHVPQQRGGARAVARGEPDDLPEDARPERLLLRMPTTSRSRSGTSRWSASRRRRCSAARSRARRSWPRNGRWSASPGTRSISGCRPRTCRGPATGSASTDGKVKLSYTETNAEAKRRLYDKLRSLLGHLDINDGHLIHRFAYMKTDIPAAGCAHQAGTRGSAPIRRRRCSTRTAGRTSWTTSTSRTRASSRASVR